MDKAQRAGGTAAAAAEPLDADAVAAMLEVNPMLRQLPADRTPKSAAQTDLCKQPPAAWLPPVVSQFSLTISPQAISTQDASLGAAARLAAATQPLSLHPVLSAQAVSIQDGGRELLGAWPLPFEGGAAAPTPRRVRKAAPAAAELPDSEDVRRWQPLHWKFGLANGITSAASGLAIPCCAASMAVGLWQRSLGPVACTTLGLAGLCSS